MCNKEEGKRLGMNKAAMTNHSTTVLSKIHWRHVSNKEVENGPFVVGFGPK